MLPTFIVCRTILSCARPRCFGAHIFPEVERGKEFDKLLPRVV